jgi:hypothetical protein
MMPMGDIVSLRNRAQQKRRAKAGGITLCRSGFHRWIVERKTPFDVKTGRLVTHYRCSRCQATRTELT